jgi:hypothetical protein
MSCEDRVLGDYFYLRESKYRENVGRITSEDVHNM